MTPSHVSAGAFALASGLALAVGGEAALGFGGGPFGSCPGMEPLAVGNLAVGIALAEPGGVFGIMSPVLAGIFDAALDIALAIGSLQVEAPASVPNTPVLALGYHWFCGWSLLDHHPLPSFFLPRFLIWHWVMLFGCSCIGGCVGWCGGLLLDWPWLLLCC